MREVSDALGRAAICYAPRHGVYCNLEVARIDDCIAFDTYSVVVADGIGDAA